MFCPRCGARMEARSPHCGACGATVSSTLQEQIPEESGRVGFSTKIEDPAYASYQKQSVAWSLIFSAILAVIAAVGFPIYGQVSGELEWPQSLYYGFGIGGMFVAIALLQTLKKRRDRTWDGIVTHKNAYRTRENNSDGSTSDHVHYVLTIRKDSGKLRKEKWRDTSGLYDYYEIGDKVRHHKGLSYYEKYDKSRDSRILCNACLTFSDINADACPRCKCPLLKP